MKLRNNLMVLIQWYAIIAIPVFIFFAVEEEKGTLNSEVNRVVTLVQNSVRDWLRINIVSGNSTGTNCTFDKFYLCEPYKSIIVTFGPDLSIALAYFVGRQFIFFSLKAVLGLISIIFSGAAVFSNKRRRSFGKDMYVSSAIIFNNGLQFQRFFLIELIYTLVGLIDRAVIGFTIFSTFKNVGVYSFAWNICDALLVYVKQYDSSSMSSTIQVYEVFVYLIYKWCYSLFIQILTLRPLRMILDYPDVVFISFPTLYFVLVIYTCLKKKEHDKVSVTTHVTQIVGNQNKIETGSFDAFFFMQYGDVLFAFETAYSHFFNRGLVGGSIWLYHRFASALSHPWWWMMLRVFLFWPVTLIWLPLSIVRFGSLISTVPVLYYLKRNRDERVPHWAATAVPGYFTLFGSIRMFEGSGFILNSIDQIIICLVAAYSWITKSASVPSFVYCCLPEWLDKLLSPFNKFIRCYCFGFDGLAVGTPSDKSSDGSVTTECSDIIFTESEDDNHYNFDKWTQSLCFNEGEWFVRSQFPIDAKVTIIQHDNYSNHEIEPLRSGRVQHFLRASPGCVLAFDKRGWYVICCHDGIGSEFDRIKAVVHLIKLPDHNNDTDGDSNIATSVTLLADDVDLSPRARKRSAPLLVLEPAEPDTSDKASNPPKEGLHSPDPVQSISQPHTSSTTKGILGSVDHVRGKLSSLVQPVRRIFTHNDFINDESDIGFELVPLLPDAEESAVAAVKANPTITAVKNTANEDDIDEDFDAATRIALLVSEADVNPGPRRTPAPLPGLEPAEPDISDKVSTPPKGNFQSMVPAQSPSLSFFRSEPKGILDSIGHARKNSVRPDEAEIELEEVSLLPKARKSAVAAVKANLTTSAVKNTVSLGDFADRDRIPVFTEHPSISATLPGDYIYSHLSTAFVVILYNDKHIDSTGKDLGERVRSYKQLNKYVIVLTNGDKVPNADLTIQVDDLSHEFAGDLISSLGEVTDQIRYLLKKKPTALTKLTPSEAKKYLDSGNFSALDDVYHHTPESRSALIRTRALYDQQEASMKDDEDIYLGDNGLISSGGHHGLGSHPTGRAANYVKDTFSRFLSILRPKHEIEEQDIEMAVPKTADKISITREMSDLIEIGDLPITITDFRFAGIKVIGRYARSHSTPMTPFDYNKHFATFCSEQYPHFYKSVSSKIIVGVNPEREFKALTRWRIKQTSTCLNPSRGRVTGMTDVEWIHKYLDIMMNTEGRTFRFRHPKEVDKSWYTPESLQHFPGRGPFLQGFKSKGEAFDSQKLFLINNWESIRGGFLPTHEWAMIPVPKTKASLKEDDFDYNCRTAICPDLWLSDLMLCAVGSFFEFAKHSKDSSIYSFAPLHNGFDARVKRLLGRDVYYDSRDTTDHGPSMGEDMFYIVKTFFLNKMRGDKNVDDSDVSCVIDALFDEIQHSRVVMTQNCGGYLVDVNSGWKDGMMYTSEIDALCTVAMDALHVKKLIDGGTIDCDAFMMQLGVSSHMEMFKKVRYEVHGDNMLACRPRVLEPFFVFEEARILWAKLGYTIKEYKKWSIITNAEMMALKIDYIPELSQYIGWRNASDGLKCVSYPKRIIDFNLTSGDADFLLGVINCALIGERWNFESCCILLDYRERVLESFPAAQPAYGHLKSQAEALGINLLALPRLVSIDDAFTLWTDKSPRAIYAPSGPSAARVAHQARTASIRMESAFVEPIEFPNQI